MRRTVPALAALALVLALTGCHPPTLSKMRGWPDTRPVFATEEEALAAAAEAYREYLAVSDEIARGGGSNPERLAPHTTPQRLEKEIELFEAVQRDGLRTSGSTQFAMAGLQYYVATDDGRSSIGLYLCIDVTEIRVIDAAGEDVTPPGRVNFYPLAVSMEATRRFSFRVATSETWGGDNFCA